MDLDFVGLEDWELLPSSDSNPVEDIKGFQVIDNDSGVLIRPDYFDSRSEYLKSNQESSGAQSLKRVGDEESGIGVGFDGVEEIDLGGAENERIEVGFVEKSELEVGFDWVGETVSRDLGGVESEKYDLGLMKKSELEVGFDGVGETAVRELGFAENEKNELQQGEMGEEVVGRDLGVDESEKTEVGLVGGVDESENSGILLSDSIGVEGNSEMSDRADSNFRDELVLGGGGEGDKHCDDVDIVRGERESGGEVEKRYMVWWKLPFEFLKYFVLRTSPVWTVSMAAAVIGFVILGRRYYSMKRKSRSVQVKVTMDDKKISQFKSRVVRLNEAFSVVKHVPIIRHSLPAAGVTPWPAMTLR
ncbi:hypothetical protein ACET3Z_015428 [Daucus carota]